MKRTILNKIEKFEHRYLKDDFEMDQTRSVQILKEQRNLRDRFNILENEVDTLNLFLTDEWHESEEELMKVIEKNLTDKETYWSKINEVINRGYDIIEPSTQHAHENKFNNLTTNLT